ncbi:MAG: hypothetical protein IJ870_04220 [Alphaproteobacteria bacterium]|nr:hypothetical protein [Alphaproteobacteria bacterium]
MADQETEEALKKVTDSINTDFGEYDQYLAEKDDDEKQAFKAYLATEATVNISDIIKKDPSKAQECYDLLDKISERALNSEVRNLFDEPYQNQYLTTSLMEAYAQGRKDESRALKSIDKINALRSKEETFAQLSDMKAPQAYFGSLNTIINQMQLHGSKAQENVAKHVFKSLEEPKDKESAEAYLDLLKNISLTNPDCANTAFTKIGKTFSKFSSSEKVQTHALSVVQQLETDGCSTFTDTELSALDTLHERFENTINIQKINRKRGQPTQWKNESDDEDDFQQQMEYDSKDKKQEIDPKFFEMDFDMEM